MTPYATMLSLMRVTEWRTCYKCMVMVHSLYTAYWYHLIYHVVSMIVSVCGRDTQGAEGTYRVTGWRWNMCLVAECGIRTMTECDSMWCRVVDVCYLAVVVGSVHTLISVCGSS